jgi:deoxyribodipyrimidine photo-lyase
MAPGSRLARLAPPLASLLAAGLGLDPGLPWAERILAGWHPGSAGAAARLDQFRGEPLWHYAAARNTLDLRGTSRLSPHLHFGEISPGQVWQAMGQAAAARSIPEATWRRWPFLTELGWREFAHYLLWHFPRTPDRPLRPEYADFPWHTNAVWLEAWQRGRTGYPVVDAGMRELWATGWMHNRARMVVASFLVKNLMISWTEGARWFWETLVDADLANNTLGWQWSGGCGADAAPFFRIFNPTRQGDQFDLSGHYVQRWLPELAPLPVRWIHQPAQAPAAVLRAAGITLDQTYLKPIVSHVISREAALDAFRRFRASHLRREKRISRPVK